MKKWIKRVALAVVVVVVAVVVGLFAAAHRDGAGHNHASVVIERPAAAAWKYVADYQQVKRWVPMLKTVTHVRGPDAFAVGAVARLEMEGAAEDEELLAVEPNKKLSMKLTGTNGEFDEVCDYTFDEKDGKTTVTADAHTDYHGMYLLLEPLITPAADKAVAESLHNLKLLVEKETPP
jgi:uncharacterized protein YndB with AHSA1/START domain